ncbi:hypothetical protein BD413DRAFT_609676 [Trametes elegans]|nr:hypothetical protein BD413DRAFT_609676 [Trametes elegans]
MYLKPTHPSRILGAKFAKQVMAQVMNPLHSVAYTPERHNSLISADEAAEQFAKAGGRAVVDGPLKELFHRHNVAEQFAIRLLHRHFDVRDGEQVVHHGNVAFPWNVPQLPASVQGAVVPSSFVATAAGEVFPYEFAFAPGGATATATTDELLRVHENFVREFAAVLGQTGLLDVLSLAVLAHFTGGSGMEITEGRANVTVPLEVSDALEGEGAIETVWTFDPQRPDAPGKCKQRCKGSPHRPVHTRGVVDADT